MTPMHPENLRRWRLSLAPEDNRRTTSKREAARRLLVEGRTYARWEAGETHIPAHVSLACAAVLYGLPPYGGTNQHQKEKDHVLHR